MISVVHNEAESRFEVVVHELTAVLDYKLRKNRIVFIHTGVPDELSGLGVGSALAEAGLTYAEDNDLVVKPYCPFIKSYIDNHPEYQALLSPRSS